MLESVVNAELREPDGAPAPPADTPDLAALCRDLAGRAKAAAQVLATARTAEKNRWLLAAASALEARTGELLDANAADIAAAPGYGLTGAAVDRLKLTPARVRAAADGLRQVAALPDPVGEVREGGVSINAEASK